MSLYNADILKACKQSGEREREEKRTRRRDRTGGMGGSRDDPLLHTDPTDLADPTD